MGENLASRCRAYIGRDGLDNFFGYITDASTEYEVFYDEGEWPDVEMALVWARERADRVVLTYGGDQNSVFSAGVVYYRGNNEKPLPIWPLIKRSLMR